MAIKVNLSLKEIYSKLCPKCRAEVVELVKGKLAEKAIKETLEGKGK